MSQRCCVEGCENTSERYPKKGTYFEGRFIRFPRDPEKWSLWNSITGSYTTARKFICSEHFTEDDWRPQDIVLNIPMAKRKLKPDAVPSLKLPVIVEDTNAMTLTANKMEMEELLEDDMSEFITYQPEDNDESSSSFVVANKIDKPLLKPSRQTSTAAKDEMDVETRKRLVAEALAEYDRLYPTASVTTKTKEQPQSYETPLDETEFAVKEYNFSVCETKKCGEITVNVDDQTFALNCSLCSGVFLDLQNFSKHVKSNHTQLLEKFSKNPLDVKQEESPDEIILPDTESNPLDSHHSTSSDSNMEVEDSPTKPMQSVYNYLSLDNQPVITTLIHLLKQNPVIWDRTHPLHSLYRIRKAAITELVAPLNKTFPEFNFTFKNVTSLVTRLRQMYVKELKRQEECLQRKTTFLPHLWCLDKLDFLAEKNESSVQTSSQPYMDDLKQIAAKPPLQPLPELNEDEMQNFTMEIIQEYKKVPSLWKINHPKYLGKLEDYETLKTLLNTIQEKFSELMFIEETQLIEFLEQLHQWFSAVESLRLHCERFQELFQCNFSHLFIALVYLRGNIAPFQCEHCKNEFHVEDNYVQHIRTKEYQDGACSQVNSYKCQYCCRRFIAQDKLTQHLRLHNTECPYVCQNCGKTFRSYTTWFTHRRSHEKIKGFVCEICGRSYYLENKLRIHRKTHLGIKDCDMCGKKFANPIDLQRHLSEVHRMKLKYECSDCGKKLKRFKSLLEHSKNCGVTS